MDKLECAIKDIYSSLEAYVYHYSFAEAFVTNLGMSNAVRYNDLVHFCITKSTKHLGASVKLIEDGFGEDALVLIRSAYEGYISIAAIFHDPALFLSPLIKDKVSLYFGETKYAISKSGKPNYRKIVNIEDGKPKDPPPNIEKLVLNTGFELDSKIHRKMYSFFSEHAHMHFIGCGNYRIGSKYITNSDSQVTNALLFGLYVSILLLDRCIRISDVEPEIEFPRCKNELINYSIVLTEFINDYPFGDEVDIKYEMIGRLKLLSSELKNYVQ